MKLKVSQTSQMPIYEQIKTQIREKIFSGELRAAEECVKERNTANLSKGKSSGIYRRRVM